MGGILDVLRKEACSMHLWSCSFLIDPLGRAIAELD